MGRYYQGDIEGKFVFGAQSSTAADRFGVEGTTPGYVDYNFDTSNLKDLELELKNIENKIGEYAYYLKAYYDLYGLETILYGDDLNISFEDYLEKLNKKPLNRDQLLEIFDYRLGKKIQACIKEQGSCSFTAEL